jgi:hypothetical protein
VVSAIVDNVTKAYPAFSNPVGRGCRSMWWGLNLAPQALLSMGEGLLNEAQGFGPIPQVVREMQMQGQEEQ